MVLRTRALRATPFHAVSEHRPRVSLGDLAATAGGGEGQGGEAGEAGGGGGLGDGRGDADRAGRVEIGGVPDQSLVQGGEIHDREDAGAGGREVEEIERIAGDGIEADAEDHVQGAARGPLVADDHAVEAGEAVDRDRGRARAEEHEVGAEGECADRDSRAEQARDAGRTANRAGAGAGAGGIEGEDENGVGAGQGDVAGSKGQSTPQVGLSPEWR